MTTHEILDSRFRANRTNLRTWRELRNIGQAMWSQAEEDQLRRECLQVTGFNTTTTTHSSCPVPPPSVSNATLWAASFDRYGLPLSDLFTYGLRPHPSSTRGARARYLTPAFCQLLVVVMVHPVFQARIHLLRHVLQRVVCLRMGVHQPPVGPAADIDDGAIPVLDDMAEALYNADQSMGQTEAYHGALWLYIQEHGVQTHPEVVHLVNAIGKAIEHERARGGSDVPADSTPDCRNLFFLQLWDLQLLVRVLDGMASSSSSFSSSSSSSHGSYLPAEAYHRQWLSVTRRVRPYIETKVDALVESWFLLDERNHRVRQKLMAQRSGRPVFDVAEEDFRPLYAKSGLITVGMRSVLCGDYLRPLCPFVGGGTASAGGVVGLEVQSGLTVDAAVQEEENIVDAVQAGDYIDYEMQDLGTEVQSTNNSDNDDIIDPQETDDDLELQAAYNNYTAMQATTTATANDDNDDDTEVESAKHLDNPTIPPRGVTNPDDSDEYEPSIGGDSDDYEDHETVRARRSRLRRHRRSSSSESPSGSIASFYSVNSSEPGEWAPPDGADELPEPRNEHIARRSLPEQACHRPAFQRRLGFD